MNKFKQKMQGSILHKVFAISTAMAFVLVPLAQSPNTAIAQEAPECSVKSDVIVSDVDTDVDDGTAVAVAEPLPEAWTSIDGATWIWNDAQVEEGASLGTLVFTKTFNWESDATTTAELEIAADNTYSVTVNTQDAGSSADEDNFSSSDTIDISEFMVDGENTVEFTVTNLGEEPNPAGLLYRIDLSGFDCEAATVTPTGEIISPTEGEVVSGTTTLEAIYNDGDGALDNDVQWAVRNDVCEVGTTTVFGNVNGLDDPFDWDGANFSADIDTTSVADGDYCFIFNPTDDGETDVRDAVTFNILNDEGGDEPTGTTTITIHKEIINDDGGTATTTDFMLLVGDMEVESGVETEIDPGTYVVSESGTSTVDYEATYTGDCDVDGNITIDEGQQLSCTITNNDISEEAPVCEATEFNFESDSQTQVNGTSSVPVDVDSETEGNQIPDAWTADIDGATWIWSDAQNDGGTATGTEVFSREFTWNSDATTTAMLYIATDNTYSVSINGDEVASSTDENNYELLTQDQYDVSNAIVNGTNTIEIAVTNVELEGDGNNPAGLLYALNLDGFDCPDDDEPIDDDEPVEDDDDENGGGSGGIINSGGSNGDDGGGSSGQVLGSSIDLFDGEDAQCELTNDAENLRTEIEFVLRNLEDIVDMAQDDEFNDAENELEDLSDDIRLLEEMLSDEGFDNEADEFASLIRDLTDEIDNEDEDEVEDIARDIADVLGDVYQDLEDECEDDDVRNTYFQPTSGSVMGATTYPNFPNTGAGGGSNSFNLSVLASLILLGSGIGFLALLRHRIKSAGHSHEDMATSIFDR